MYSNNVNTPLKNFTTNNIMLGIRKVNIYDNKTNRSFSKYVASRCNYIDYHKGQISPHEVFFDWDIERGIIFPEYLCDGRIKNSERIDYVFPLSDIKNCNTVLQYLNNKLSEKFLLQDDKAKTSRILSENKIAHNSINYKKLHLDDKKFKYIDFENMLF